MSYASTAEFRKLMDQVPAGATEDTLIQLCLDAATQIIDTEIGHTWAAGVVGTAVVYGDDTAVLIPPAFVPGSVTLVSAPAAYSVPSYVETSGRLVTVDSGGVLQSPFYRNGWRYPYSWQAGVPYTVSASYGWGAAPADIKQACLEIAVAIYRGRDAGYSDVVGTAGSGGEVAYVGKWSKRADATLKRYRQAANPARIT
jgi:hypothetical protein